jgi:hypothetical protein
VAAMMEDLKLNETVRSTQSGKPSPFAGHHQRRRRHVPPFLDLPVEMTLRPFAKVAFPDMLWLLTMLRLRPLLQGRGPATFALDIGQICCATRTAAAHSAQRVSPCFKVS